MKAGVLIQLMRLACTNANGPSLYHLLEVLGKEKVVGRIQRAIGTINNVHS